MAKRGGYWREAATVILMTKTPTTSSSHASSRAPASDTTDFSLLSRLHFNYQVLLLKRSGGSSFMPELHVFPGGTLSDADFDAKWIPLYERYKHESFQQLTATFQQSKCPPPAFTEPRMTSPGVTSPGVTSHVPAEIAFRICAIRECFEECGVLLARKIPRDHGNHSSTSGSSAHLSQPLVPLSSQDLNSSTWRKRVNKNAQEFVTLCTEHNLVPDLWALQEWSNWLTPVMKPVTEPPAKPRRFDTIFYVCCLDAMPGHVKVDGRETTVLKWGTPADFLRQHLSAVTPVSGPQLYELSRLCHFTDFDKLREYVVRREVEGIVRYLPVPVLCSDGVIILYPGDELYPADPDVTGLNATLTSVEKSVDEMNAAGTRLNRSYRLTAGGVQQTLSNIPAQCGLVPPVKAVMPSLI